MIDLENKEYQELALDFVNAAKGEDEKAFQEAAANFGKMIEQRVLTEAEKIIEAGDTTILASRGVRGLTSAETKYYEKVIDAMKSGAPQQALADLDVVMPITIIEDVFSDLETGHPLLDAIDFQYGRGVTEWLMNANEDQLATWSPLCAEIVKELTSGFKKIDVAQNKLSAFIPVCKAMLDLGPIWLDRYVRAILGEALALGLEDGILNGKGQTQNLHEPIGMRKNLTGAVDPAAGYPDKAKVAITELTPTAYGEILAQLAKTDNGRSRIVTGVIMVVNPTDYLTKVMPATTPRGADGSYTYNVFPFPTTVIQSAMMPEGEAIIGLGSRYLMVSGSGKAGTIEYSDQYHFLEDERVYLTKFYGHGQAKDNNSFILADITGLVPSVADVKVVNASEFPNG